MKTKATKPSVASAPANLAECGDKRIVALRERFVFIGMYHPATDTAPAYLSEAYNIRYFGTTAGLGEIALNGPTPKTILDPVGVLVLDNPNSVLFTIPCQK